jgi:hypothetical protein
MDIQTLLTLLLVLVLVVLLSLLFKPSKARHKEQFNTEIKIRANLLSQDMAKLDKLRKELFD